MLTVRVADFEADNAAIRHIRFAVFVDEQHVPEDLEIDDRDRECMHVLAFDGDTPVGTARIDLQKAGKVGRLAVTAESRRRGIGTALMERLHAIAQAHGLTHVWCHAQLAAMPFYERLGYRASGDMFDEADIPHLRMDCELNASSNR
jgi:predicted GNAT family N-acyltransferase